MCFSLTSQLVLGFFKTSYCSEMMRIRTNCRTAVHRQFTGTYCINDMSKKSYKEMGFYFDPCFLMQSDNIIMLCHLTDYTYYCLALGWPFLQ